MLNGKTPITLLLAGCRNQVSCSLPPFTATRLDVQKVPGKEQHIYNNSKASWLEAAMDGKISINQGVCEEEGNTS